MSHNYTTVLDIETSFKPSPEYKSMLEGNSSPFLAENFIVSIAYKIIETGEAGFLYYTNKDFKSNIQSILDKTSTLVGFNLKFDLSWLLESGFNYDKNLWDCQVVEYLLSGHTLTDLSLNDTALLYNLPTKLDKVKELWIAGVNTQDISTNILQEYNEHDVSLTASILISQQLKLKDAPELLPTINLCNEFIYTLIAMYRTGVQIDLNRLAELKEMLQEELKKINSEMGVCIYELCGDKYINTSSPEQLSQFVYSRTVNDKKEWANAFNLEAKENKFQRAAKLAKLNQKYFESIVKTQTSILKRGVKTRCTLCNGEKYIDKQLKTKVKKVKCPDCKAAGIIIEDTAINAGLKITPKRQWITNSGFSTSKTILESILEDLKFKNTKQDAQRFLELVSKHNSYEVYLNTFIASIEKVNINSVLHANFNNTRTSTGRLSSSEPNMQNIPTIRTFPLKELFVSRWDGGYILDTDMSQLEFRAAIHLAQDPSGKEDIENGVDIHQLSANALGIERDDAKAFCVPLSTQILTKRGWKTYDTVEIGEEVLAYDIVSKKSVWTPLLDVHYFSNVPTVILKNKHNIKLECTKDHKWVTYQRNGELNLRKVEEFNSETNIKITDTLKEGLNPLTKKEMYLLGWLFGDGTFKPSKKITDFSKGSSQGINNIRRGINARLIQKKLKGRYKIEKLLKPFLNSSYTGADGVVTYCLKSAKIRDIFNRARIDMDSPNLDFAILNSSYTVRQAFIAGVCRAEGTQRKHKEWRIAQNAGSFAESIHLAAYLNGYDVRVVHGISRTGKIHKQYNLRKRQHITNQRLTIADGIIQDVWCPRTKYGTWVMRQGDNMTITGNTFKPLYGGSQDWGLMKKYPQIAVWHSKLIDAAVSTGKVVLPTGRYYNIDARRTAWGCTNQTKVKNYPVQGFATADIVPAIMIELEKALRGFRSKLVLTVHDSILIDVHPEEKDIIISIVKNIMNNGNAIIKRRYGIDLYVPFKADIKIGKNAGNLEKVVDKI